MPKLFFPAAAACLLLCMPLRALDMGQVQGVVHDPEHRPIAGASVSLRAAHSSLLFTAATDQNGGFLLTAVPLGVYVVTVASPGFASVEQAVTVATAGASILHFQLELASLRQTTVVEAEPDAANPDSVTPMTLIGQTDIAKTPGADRTNSLAMITDYTPGAYMTHDMLHMRGGHELNWLIDGVPIPNTNIASNIGPQIDPRDIDYVEIDRGSYNADMGDRTYGMFNIVPRTGFERDREGEFVATGGSFYQTDDQLSLGDHTEKFAWYASANGNRSDYGLAPPVPQVVHDADNGYGGFGSFIYNRDPKDQFRAVTQLRRDFYQIPYDPNPNDAENAVYDSSGLRDGEHETDALGTVSWMRTLNETSLVEVSPFYHYNKAAYQPNKNDTPVATTADQTGNYAGLQAYYATDVARNSLKAGIYGYAQHEGDLFAAAFPGGGNNQPFSVPNKTLGGVEEAFAEDNYKATSWLTLIGGLRQSHFQADITDNAIDPRVGIALQLPKLQWVFRAFYGRFYQPPPLTSISGPLLAYANGNDTGFVPLHGERDEEHQFGLQIPWRGWLLDADNFETRATNFLDHSNVGESSIFIPVTVAGALIQGWELTLRSPRLWEYGQFHLAYSNQLAEQRGAITGGLICYPPNSAACAPPPGYIPLDHDQRNTLSVGFDANLPRQIFASANVSYGSGFTNGDPNAQYPGAYLPQHESVDLALGKTFGDKLTVTANAMNVANDRVLLDNSLTFGGFHYSDPRQVYGEVRYRFHF